jgi:hypothetical protein
LAKYYRRWLKIGAGVAASVGTIIGLFAILISVFNFHITGEDAFCAGTLDDPCMSRVWIENPTKYDVDVYNQDEIMLSFSPEVPDYKIFRKDGRCSGKKGSSCCSTDGICLKGWKFTDFTEKTRPRQDKVYVQRFPAYSVTEFLVWGLKNNPTDRIKWGFEINSKGLHNGYLDPIWSYNAELGGSGELKLHLKMEGDALDSSGQGNDGTVTGASLTNGKYGLGYNFDGTDDYIEIGNNSNLNSGSYTLSSWIKTTSDSTQRILQLNRRAGATKITNRISLSGGFAELFWHNGTTFNEITSSTVVTDGNWHLVTSTHNGTSFKIYVDGTLESEKVDILNSAFYDVFIGSVNGSSTFFDGVVDDVRIYNRSLTASEVRELYNESLVSNYLNFYGNSQEQIIDDNKEVLHLKFEGNALDSSGNGNDGVVSGASVTNGRIGLGYNFDGVNDRISVSAYNSTGNITVSLWFKTNGQVTSQQLIHNSWNSAEAQFILGFGSSGELVALHSSDGSTYFNSSNSNVFNDEQWHNSIFVFNGTKLDFYVDGILQTQNAPIGGSSTQNFFIGAKSSNTNYFNGIIDDVRIYNRSLTASEVRELYNESSVSDKISFYGNASINFYGNPQET